MPGLIQKAYDRLELLHAMMDHAHAKADFDTTVVGENTLHSCVTACLLCSNADTCVEWFSECEAGDQIPAFCPNAERLNRMIEPTA